MEEIKGSRSQLKALERKIFDAAASEDLPVDQDADTTDMMLQDFKGGDEDVIRAVHYLSDNEFLLTVHASHFFSDVADRVKRGDVKKVWRLFILTEDYELEDNISKRFLAFHEATAGFDYRVIRKRDYDRVRRDFGLPTDTKDFGLYGDRFVYRSLAAADNEIKGVFSANDALVRRFAGAFDRCWSSELSFRPSPEGLPAPSLRDLFGRDPISPNRPGVPQIGAGSTPRISPPVEEPAAVPPSSHEAHNE